MNYKKILVLFMISLIGLLFISCDQSQKYSVYFNSLGGTEVNSVKVKPGQRVPIPSVEKNGYILEGWFTSVNGGQTFSEEWMFLTFEVDNDLTLYAKWIPLQYELKFMVDGFNTETLIVGYESEIVFPENPQKLGYVFIGWYYEEECLTLFNDETMPLNDLVLYAGWDRPFILEDSHKDYYATGNFNGWDTQTD